MKLNKYIAIALLSGCSTLLFLENQHRFYFEGMLVDNDLLNVIPAQGRELLSSRNAYAVTARYSDGSEALIVNGKQPPYVSLHAGLWDATGRTIHGSSLTNSSFLAGEVTEGSGFAFHTVDGKLYAYSSGEVRDNPERFEPLLIQSLDHFVDLIETVKYRDF